MSPQNVSEFFDIAALRRTGQKLFIRKIKANRLYTIKQHTFASGDRVRIRNTGNVILKFYLAQMKDGSSFPPFVEIQVGEERIVTAEQLGELSNTFLIVKNEQTVDGSYVVELLG